MLLSRLISDLADLPIDNSLWFFKGWSVIGSDSYAEFSEQAKNISKEIVWEIVGFDHIIEKGIDDTIRDLEKIFSFSARPEVEIASDGEDVEIDPDDIAYGHVVEKIKKDDIEKIKKLKIQPILSGSSPGYTDFKLLVFNTE